MEVRSKQNKSKEISIRQWTPQSAENSEFFDNTSTYITRNAISPEVSPSKTPTFPKLKKKKIALNSTNQSFYSNCSCKSLKSLPLVKTLNLSTVLIPLPLLAIPPVRNNKIFLKKKLLSSLKNINLMKYF